MGITEDIVNNTGPRLPWAGKRVRMDQVEDELSSLWRMSADNVRISRNMNVRTSVLNFVICAPTTEIAQQASTIIRNLSSTHVARVILLILDTTPQSANTVFTWVTLRSFPVISDVMRHSFEQITILASGSAVRATSTIIHPLLKPDLPVYVWWLSDPSTDPETFNRIAHFSNRVIVDSDRFHTPEESVRTLSSLVSSLSTSAVSDLNWGRITTWRQLMAQFFDASEYKPYFAGIEHIEIEYAIPSPDALAASAGDGTPNTTRALLMAAWLKTSLGWQVSADASTDGASPRGTYHWQMLRTPSPSGARSTSGTGRTGKLKAIQYGTIDIRPRVQPDMQAGSLCMTRLTSNYDGKQAVFMVNRGDDRDHVLTSVELSQGSRPQRTVSLAATHDISELLHDELEIMGRDHLYEATLQEVFALLV